LAGIIHKRLLSNPIDFSEFPTFVDEAMIVPNQFERVPPFSISVQIGSIQIQLNCAGLFIKIVHGNFSGNT
jgi:hypothetical protein